MINVLNELYGIHLIESDYCAPGVAVLIGTIDTKIKAFGRTIGQFPIYGKEMIGTLDFNKGEMKIIKGAVIHEIRADKITMSRLKDLLEELSDK